MNDTQKYVTKKTGKMGAQLTGNNVVAVAIYYAVKRLGVEMTPEETMAYMAAFNVVGPMIIKFFEKIMSKK
jgi:hypothetical protein